MTSYTARRVMYGVFHAQAKEKAQPIALFEFKRQADDWRPYNSKLYTRRVWVTRENMEVYTIAEHNGYRSRGFKEKLFGKPTY